MFASNLIQPLVLIAIGLAGAAYAATESSSLGFAFACFIAVLVWDDCRKTALVEADAEKLTGRDAQKNN